MEKGGGYTPLSDRVSVWCCFWGFLGFFRGLVVFWYVGVIVSLGYIGSCVLAFSICVNEP
jgi:hypothetical protein